MNDLFHNKEKNEEYVSRARELVGKMTLREKVSQMVYTAPAIERLGIPAYNWWNEALHGVARAGVATVFPQAVGLAASFDPELMQSVGDAISTEGRAKYNVQSRADDRDIYKGLTFWTPNINIFRDPRWGRGHETYGEDPCLTSRMGVAMVRGLQGDDPNYLKLAACAKHFAVHSGPEDLRHSFNAEASKQDLWETYLPAFRALVTEAGVEAVMGAYNRTNGEACCGSKTLLHDILREKWGFKGHVTSDCWAIKDFFEGHHVTEGPVEAVALAVKQGCDLNCGELFTLAEEAVNKGLLTEDDVTEAVVRLFTTRMRLGMFEEDKTPYSAIGYDVVDSDEMRALNRSVSEKCVVLLKNEGNILPLDKNKIKTIGVIGPNADNRRALVGNYEGTSSRYVTVLEGLQDYLGDSARVMYSQGCHLYRDHEHHIASGLELGAEVKAVCDASDVVIAVMGLDSGLEGEEGDQGNQFASGDKLSLRLPGRQEEVLRLIKESGKPAVLVILAGSALAVNYADENIPAVLMGWYPGGQGGAAIARILFGDAVPQGKLPVTFYRTDEELPPFTDYSMKGRTYRYMTQEALYPFGFGLSYAKFAFSDAAVTKSEDGYEVTVSVKNTGSVAGVETVEVYVKAERENTPNAQLKAFCKAALEPGEAKTVTLALPISAFALCDEEGVAVVEPGKYSVYAGASQPDSRSVALMGAAPLRVEVEIKERAVIG